MLSQPKAQVLLGQPCPSLSGLKAHPGPFPALADKQGQGVRPHIDFLLGYDSDSSAGFLSCVWLRASWAVGTWG